MKPLKNWKYSSLYPTQTLPELSLVQLLSLNPTLPHVPHVPSIWVYKPFCKVSFTFPALGKLRRASLKDSSSHVSPAGLIHTLRPVQMIYSRKLLILSPTPGFSHSELVVSFPTTLPSFPGVAMPW